MSVAHVAFDLRPGGERGDRVDDDDVDSARTHEHVGDLEGLFTRVGLGDEQLVDVDPDGLGVDGVHRVLGIDIRTDAAVALRLGHDVQRQRGLARGFGAVDLGDPAAWEAPDAEGEVE
ncbi:unannotated protein [freshwater metagenome]|uniref:Unannotated protein n=1 Tax=freshwater metagenome TaxID=449393 RepID=A0A6J7AT91_9ZZZZ